MMPRITTAQIKSIIADPRRNKYLLKNEDDYDKAVKLFPNRTHFFLKLILGDRKLFRQVVQCIDTLYCMMSDHPSLRLQFYRRLLRSKITFFKLIKTVGDLEVISELVPDHSNNLVDKFLLSRDKFKIFLKYNLLQHSRLDNDYKKYFARRFGVSDIKRPNSPAIQFVLYLSHIFPDKSDQILETSLIELDLWITFFQDVAYPKGRLFFDSLQWILRFFPDRVDEIFRAILNHPISLTYIMSYPGQISDVLQLEELKVYQDDIIDRYIEAIKCSTASNKVFASDIIKVADLYASKHDELINLLFSHTSVISFPVKDFISLCEKAAQKEPYIDWLLQNVNILYMFLDDIASLQGCDLLVHAARWKYRSEELLTLALTMPNMSLGRGVFKFANHVTSILYAFPHRKDDLLQYMILCRGFFEYLKQSQSPSPYQFQAEFNILKRFNTDKISVIRLIGQYLNVDINLEKQCGTENYLEIIYQAVNRFRLQYSLLTQATVCLAQGRRQHGNVLEGMPADVMHKIAGFVAAPNIQNGEVLSRRYFQSHAVLFSRHDNHSADLGVARSKVDIFNISESTFITVDALRP